MSMPGSNVMRRSDRATVVTDVLLILLLADASVGSWL